MRSLACVFAVLVAVATAAPSPAGRQRHLGAVDSDLLVAEMQAWKAAGQPDFIQFEGDDQKPVWAAVVGNQPGGNVHGPTPFDSFLPGPDDIKFHLYTVQNDDDIQGTVVDLNATSLLDAGFDKSRPTKVVIHGFTNTIASRIIQMIKNAYLGSGSFNVIGVDWGKLCPEPLYVTSRLNVPVAGTRVSEMLQVLVNGGLADASDIHVIGHSLGAHVAGLAGKGLNEATGKRLTRITGLDPAWPLFMLTAEANRLYKEDADVVDVIHTCAGMLGFASALGTSDFYPNGGSGQPGCGVDLAGMCSHSRSFEYFAETITTGKGLQAVYCNSDSDARSGACTTQDDGCMGDEVYFKESGSYFLKTDTESDRQPCSIIPQN